MEKESCQIKITETDDGFRIDVKGKNLKDVGCCMPIFQSCTTAKTDCCPPEEDKK